MKSKRGYLYAMSNPSFPGLLKIGRTTKDPRDRAYELSATGVPTPFKVEFSIKVSNAEAAERIVHSRFAKYREYSNKEFFRVSIHQVINLFPDAESDGDFLESYTLRGVPKPKYFSPGLLTNQELREELKQANKKRRNEIFEELRSRLPENLQGPYKEMSIQCLREFIQFMGYPSDNFSAILHLKAKEKEELAQEKKRIDKERQESLTRDQIKQNYLNLLEKGCSTDEEKMQIIADMESIGKLSDSEAVEFTNIRSAIIMDKLQEKKNEGRLIDRPFAGAGCLFGGVALMFFGIGILAVSGGDGEGFLVFLGFSAGFGVLSWLFFLRKR